MGEASWTNPTHHTPKECCPSSLPCHHEPSRPSTSGSAIHRSWASLPPAPDSLAPSHVKRVLRLHQTPRIAQFETYTQFLGSFEALDDTRQQAKVLYPLPEILLLCLCAVLGGADSWVDVALYGQHKLGFLRRLLPFAHGVPSHDQLGNVFARLDPQQFQSCFIAWVERFTTAVRGVVAVDGKTLRRSFDRAAEQGPIHMISAWSSQQRLVLGQCKVADKSNEITAIPELLQLLELHGAVVTIDAMGCQRTIAAQIIDQNGKYSVYRWGGGFRGAQSRRRKSRLSG